MTGFVDHCRQADDDRQPILNNEHGWGELGVREKDGRGIDDFLATQKGVAGGHPDPHPKTKHGCEVCVRGGLMGKKHLYPSQRNRKHSVIGSSTQKKTRRGTGPASEATCSTRVDSLLRVPPSPPTYTQVETRLLK